jgi:hypothetical protein
MRRGSGIGIHDFNMTMIPFQHFGITGDGHQVVEVEQLESNKIAQASMF